MKEIHFFDLDNTLWELKSEIWIIDKEKPYKPVVKLSNLEFSLIKNGIYKKDNIVLDYNGNRYFISKNIWDKIYKIKKSENTQRFGISFKNFGTKDDINKSKLKFLLDNIKHLKGKNVEIGILTARPNLKIHSDVVNELRLKLKDMGLSLDKIFFVGEKFDMSYEKIGIKKTQILLEHLIGFKIKNNRFVSVRQDWYDKVYFYDDDKMNIDYANDIQKILNDFLNKTDDELFKIILNRINYNDIYIINNLITNNDLNRFEKTKIKIKEPNKYPIKVQENFIFKFNDYFNRDRIF